MCLRSIDNRLLADGCVISIGAESDITGKMSIGKLEATIPIPMPSPLYCRISLTLSCPMDLKLYPLDKQTCSLKMASCKYLLTPPGPGEGTP